MKKHLVLTLLFRVVQLICRLEWEPHLFQTIATKYGGEELSDLYCTVIIFGVMYCSLGFGQVVGAKRRMQTMREPGSMTSLGSQHQI